MTESLGINVVPHGDVIEIQLSDRLIVDPFAPFDLPNAVEKEVQLRQPTSVVFSLAAVSSCTTSLVNGLLKIHKTLTQQQRAMMLCEVPPIIERTLQELNLAEVFEIHDLLAEALESGSH